MKNTKETDLKKLYEKFLAECEEIEEECRNEGYPPRGSNYELRVEALKDFYPELFADDEDEEIENSDISY